MKRLFAAAVVLATAAGVASAQAIQADPGLATYPKVSGVSGNINSVGSDTMNNLMTLWAEGFQRFHPEVSHLDAATRFLQFHSLDAAGTDIESYD